MANTVLADLATQVENTKTVEASAAVLILSIGSRIAAAVAEAIANGATAEELAPVTAEVAALNASATALSDAVAANP